MLGGFLAVGSQHRAIEGWMDAHALIPQEEHFTELFFNDHQHLPSTITLGKTEKFAFTIHNEEGKDMEYNYVVNFETTAATATERIASSDAKSVSLLSGEYSTIEVTYVLKDTGIQEGAITVTLVGRKEQIRFLLHK
jgi:hypothetical protein